MILLNTQSNPAYLKIVPKIPDAGRYLEETVNDNTLKFFMHPCKKYNMT